MAFPGTEQLTNMITPIVEPRGLDVEAMKITRAGKKSVVSIRLDGDTHPTSDELEAVSNDVSELFDDAEAAGEVNFGAGYTLEVSTPGVDLPLTLPRHFRRNRHRLISLNGEGYRIGALSDDEGHVILVKSGLKRITGEQVLDKKVSELAGAVVDIEFKNPAEAETELTGLTYDEAITWREDHK